MGGVVHGTRLDQLQALHRATRLQHRLATRAGHSAEQARLADLLNRLDTVITTERARAARAAARPTQARTALAATQATLDQLGVTTATVRAWAVQQHLLEPGRRGRLPSWIVDAYAARDAVTIRPRTQEPTP